MTLSNELLTAILGSAVVSSVINGASSLFNSWRDRRAREREAGRNHERQRIDEQKKNLHGLHEAVTQLLSLSEEFVRLPAGSRDELERYEVLSAKDVEARAPVAALAMRVRGDDGAIRTSTREFLESFALGGSGDPQSRQKYDRLVDQIALALERLDKDAR